MSISEQDKDYQGIKKAILMLSIVFLGIHIYFYCYNTVEQLGVTHALIDRSLLKINQSTGHYLFNNVFNIKLLTVLLLVVYSVGNKARKSLDLTWNDVVWNGCLGIILFFGNIILLEWRLWPELGNVLYALTCISGYIFLLRAGSYASRILEVGLGKDAFNLLNESFEQEERKIENGHSVHIASRYFFKGKWRDGWINIINPFRATMVLGTPGSGKSFAVVNQFIKQQLAKGYTMYVYDFKYPTLSKITYNYLLTYQRSFKKKPTFYIINFDNPRQSHRCNPLLPELMTKLEDAQEASKTILLNLNKSWIQKQGDFFVESPINFLTAVIWFLKRYDDRRLEKLSRQNVKDDGKRYCTFPHTIELASAQYKYLFPILQAEAEIENLLQPFASALENGAYDQLEGQIASARIPLSRLSTKDLYWVMAGNDFSLDINDPNDPKILCVGNNPELQDTYGAALGLYNARLVKIVNKKGKLPSAIIVDELPTIYFKGLDNLIATARDNLVAVLLSLQDLTQLIRDYGEKEAKAIFNTIGNIISGQVLGETAKLMSARMGKNVQLNKSVSITQQDTNITISERLDNVIPEDKISSLSQGFFVGMTGDNVDQLVDQKRFHCKLIVPDDDIKLLKSMQDIPLFPEYSSLTDKEMSEMMEDNYHSIKEDIKDLIEHEIERIDSIDELRFLVAPILAERAKRTEE